MLKPRASFDSLNVDALSGKGKFSLPTLRRYSSTTNLHQEHVNTPQILHRSLSSIFKKIPKTPDEKKENDFTTDDYDNASIISSDSSQLSFDEDTTKSNNKFISIFNNAFNNKNGSNNHNNNNNNKRKKYNFNEIIVSNEIIITTSDIMDEHSANFLSASPTPFTTFETHLQTPTQNYSYYYPNKSTVILPNNNRDLSPMDETFSISTQSLKSRLSTPLLSEDDMSETQTSSRESTSSQEVIKFNSPNQVLRAIYSLSEEVSSSSLYLPTEESSSLSSPIEESSSLFVELNGRSSSLQSPKLTGESSSLPTLTEESSPSPSLTEESSSSHSDESSSSASPITISLKVPLNIPPPPPLNIPPPPKMIIHDTATKQTTEITEIIEITEITETWPFARFPQRSTFHNLSNLPPSIPPSPTSTPFRYEKSSPPSKLPSPVEPTETTSYNSPKLNYNYGICEKCQKPRTGILWCQSCYPSIFQQNFNNWTSGHDKIDEFIKNTQLNSNNICELLEWIPFEKLRDLQLIGEGGYSTVYLAKWIDGRILDLNEDGNWERTGENDVVLKILYDSKDLSQEYLNELETYHKCTPKLNHILRCYGISRDPFAKNTIMVMEYAKDGNLKDYLKDHFTNFTWTKRISMLNDIIQSIKSFHATGLVHKNLHSGNVLIHDDCAFIGDLGLCSKVQEKDSISSSYGVMPYVAPEVLKGNQFTVASDIYSFGMIMYELAISLPPYYEYSLDKSLLHDICNEIRPNVLESVPKSYSELMTKCWSQNPEDRPNADYVAQIIEDWKNNGSEEFNIAEKARTNEIDDGATNILENLLGNYKSKALPKFDKNE